MERCTCRRRNSQPLKIELGPLPVDERARYVESVCNTLDDSRNDRFWWDTVFLHTGRSGWITGYWTGGSDDDAHARDINFIHVSHRSYQPPIVDTDTRLMTNRHGNSIRNQPGSDIMRTAVDADSPHPLVHAYLARGPTPIGMRSSLFTLK